MEDQLRTNCPRVDLTTGPKVDFSFLDAMLNASPEEIQHRRPSSAPQNAPPSTSGPPMPTSETPTRSAGPSKRAYASVEESSELDRPFSEEARSVALDLGLLSLNSDSRQKHYLGSSSGRLFTSLIGAESTKSSPASTGSPTSLAALRKPRPFAHGRKYKEVIPELFSRLRKVSCFKLWYTEPKGPTEANTS